MLNTYIKWTATAILIIGTAVNGLGYYPEGPAMLVLGGFLWLIVAVRVKDAPLIVTNLVMSTCLLYTSPSPRDGLLSRMPSSA